MLFKLRACICPPPPALVLLLHLINFPWLFRRAFGTGLLIAAGLYLAGTGKVGVSLNLSYCSLVPLCVSLASPHA